MQHIVFKSLAEYVLRGCPILVFVSASTSGDTEIRVESYGSERGLVEEIINGVDRSHTRRPFSKRWSVIAGAKRVSYVAKLKNDRLVIE